MFDQNFSSKNYHLLLSVFSPMMLDLIILLFKSELALNTFN